MVNNAPVAESLPFPKVSADVVRRVALSPTGMMGIAAAALLTLVFFGYLKSATHAWFKPESYIQHGVFVPFACLYLGWRAWKQHRETMPLKPVWWPVVFLIPMSLVSAVISRAGLVTLSGGLLMACVTCVVWMAMGHRWLFKMVPALAFSVFAMTFWPEYMDALTLPAQQVSGWVAFKLLQVVQMKPYTPATDPSLIILPHYEMSVGAACSGLKLTLAVLTASVFIAIVGRLGWWKNAILVAAVLPLAMLNNSLRIACVGVAGEFGGRQWGEWMHDYGAYGVMLLAFYALYRLAVALGWKL